MSTKGLFDSLLSEIQAGNVEDVESRMADLSAEQLDELFAEAQPYKSLGTASSKKFVLGAVSNLREKYLKKLIITSMVGFLFQMKDEYTVDDDELVLPPAKEDFLEDGIPIVLPDNFDVDKLRVEELVAMYAKRHPDGKLTNRKDMEDALAEEDLLTIGQVANDRYKKLTEGEKTFNAALYGEAVEAAVAEQSDSERVVINRFLERLFRFDADRDSQAGSNDTNGDPERVDPSTLAGTSAVYDNIPSNDTHCRFNSYYDINYEAMREATQNIYNVKPDLEHAMIVYDVLDKQSDVDSFIHKYGANSKYDIVSFPLNQWTFMGPFKENRERIDFYNKQNNIIKSMLEQQETDAALGEELMKKRVRTKKSRAEKVFGKDSKGFAEYAKLNPSELQQKYNATKVELDDGSIKIIREVTLDVETGKELAVDADGVPTSGLEVPITSINAKTGKTTQTRIFTASENQ